MSPAFFSSSAFFVSYLLCFHEQVPLSTPSECLATHCKHPWSCQAVNCCEWTSQDARGYKVVRYTSLLWVSRGDSELESFAGEEQVWAPQGRGSRRISWREALCTLYKPSRTWHHRRNSGCVLRAWNLVLLFTLLMIYSFSLQSDGNSRCIYN